MEINAAVSFNSNDQSQTNGLQDQDRQQGVSRDGNQEQQSNSNQGEFGHSGLQSHGWDEGQGQQI